MKMKTITLMTLLYLLSMTYSLRTTLSGDSKCCEDNHTIIVTGTASVSLPSDLIKIKVAMETKENLATNSLKKNTDISRTVDRALKQLGLKSSDISTTSFTINANYKSVLDKDGINYRDVFDGYKVVNEIEIRVKELSFVGKTVDRVINAGATTITGITFTNDDALIKKTKKELLSQAADDAIEKANLLLAPLKLKIKDILTISNVDSTSEQFSDAVSGSNNNNNNNNNVSIPKVYANGNIVSASVSITFLIEKV
jgi:uncharacterized protein YggE